MLLGQTGLLSFGHAVYYGLGGFVAIHAMNAVIRNKYADPVAASSRWSAALAGLVLRRDLRFGLDAAGRHRCSR